MGVVVLVVGPGEQRAACSVQRAPGPSGLLVIKSSSCSAGWLALFAALLFCLPGQRGGDELTPAQLQLS
eukprot:scaffold172914_cov31-Tisochrysis_lutea.AAC.1